MGNKNKSKNNSFTSPKQDSFDVKTNLKKLSNSNRQNGSSDYSYFKEEKTDSEVISSNHYSSGFEESTYKEFKELTSKIHDNYSSLKDDLHQAKDTINSKLSNDVSDLKKEIESKLDSKIDNKYFLGAIAVLVMIISIITFLSYAPMIEDVKNLKVQDQNIFDSIRKVNKRIEKVDTK